MLQLPSVKGMGQQRTTSRARVDFPSGNIVEVLTTATGLQEYDRKMAARRAAVVRSGDLYRFRRSECQSA